ETVGEKLDDAVGKAKGKAQDKIRIANTAQFCTIYLVRFGNIARSGKIDIAGSGHYFIDGDPRLFRVLLNYFRTCKLSHNRNTFQIFEDYYHRLLLESEYYELYDIYQKLAEFYDTIVGIQSTPIHMPQIDHYVVIDALTFLDLTILYYICSLFLIYHHKIWHPLKKSHGLIDLSPPREYPHFTQRLKQKQIREYQEAQIEGENARLRNNIMHVVQAGGYIDSKNDYVKKSLNADKRKRVQAGYHQENVRLVQKLHSTQSQYPTVKFESEWEKQQRVKQRISRYPQGRKQLKEPKAKILQIRESIVNVVPTDSNENT
ncbi:unnamed protein product, partial [Didymodactylos carnosus]